MANKTASLRLRLSYTSPSGAAVQLPEMVFQCPYQAHCVSGIDVPDATAADATLPVPFGPVAEASCVVLVNRTGQDLDVKINGAAAASHSLPDDSVMSFAAGDVGGTPIESIDLITTATQEDAGLVECLVFGDPT